jgi:hypothetical protein
VVAADIGPVVVVAAELAVGELAVGGHFPVHIEDRAAAGLAAELAAEIVVAAEVGGEFGIEHAVLEGADTADLGPVVAAVVVVVVAEQDWVR